MSKKQQRATSAKPQPAAGPKWLLPTVFAVAAVAVVAIVVWLVQGQQATVTSGTAVPGKPTVTSIPAVTGQPRAAIDQTKYDYGDVKLGSTIQTVFKVKNVGDQELVFQGEPQVEVLEGC